VKLIEAKLPWILYNKAFDEFNEVKKERQKAEACLEARKQEYEESQQPLRYHFFLSCHLKIVLLVIASKMLNQLGIKAWF